MSAPQTRKEPTYEDAKLILHDNGFKFTTATIRNCAYGSCATSRTLRLEVYGGGTAIDERIQRIRALLPQFSVVRGNQEYIFITIKKQP